MCSFYVQLMLRIQISTFFANHSALSDKGLSLRSSLNEENECVFNKGYFFERYTTNRKQLHKILEFDFFSLVGVLRPQDLSSVSPPTLRR